MRIRRITGILTCIFFCIFYTKARAQLGFCSGNKGAPIFMETFGTGTVDGPALPAGRTTYQYVSGRPFDGQYTISSFTDYFEWHNTPDHTPGDVDGRSLIFNADFTAGEFYKRTVTGLCENTSYEFSSWLINLLPDFSGCAPEIPVVVNFQIWDNTDTVLLASGDTGVIASTSSALWRQYGLVFQTVSGQSSVILKMINNSEGGCGNDLAIDDITFRTCGDAITITDTQNDDAKIICEEDIPVQLQLMATPDFSIYSSHAYQWQQSTDGINWVNITGENSSIYSTPLITNSISYRVNVAEDAINLNNTSCSSLSEIFEILIVEKPDPPISNGNEIRCENVSPFIFVEVPEDVTVNWYDSAIGGNLIASNTVGYSSAVSGTFYAEASSALVACVSDSRTPVSLELLAAPVVNDEQLVFCEGTSIVLDATIADASYVWSTGETIQKIEANTAGSYTVEITNSNGCSNIKTITLASILTPQIENIIEENNMITVITTTAGDYEYSLDGITYQSSNTFQNLSGGVYTFYVRGPYDCGEDSKSFLFLEYPQYFTPNEDGFHDYWHIVGIENYPLASTFIYDRYGKLLKQMSANDRGWDGTYQGRQVTSSEYWFHVDLKDGNIVRGHFSLIR
ncbi:hypothetical protein GCM10022393_29840 [Aquimarina addita]|uniref:Ig-like domain-containing protein n=1 Tax=Aquimarina addita TaxID=870485 RepID=A0ABP6UQG7_9FLAO